MDLAAHREHWSLIRAPLAGVDPTELLARAGLPAQLAPRAAAITAHPGFVESIWRHDVRWQLSDLDAPLPLVRALAAPASLLRRRLPLLALLAHAGAVRRMIGGREQQALRSAVGASTFARVLSMPALHDAGHAPDAANAFGTLPANQLRADAAGCLEQEGCRVLARVCAAFGAGWREALRLRLPSRLELLITAAPALPVPLQQAHSITVKLIEQVQALEPEASGGTDTKQAGSTR